MFAMKATVLRAGLLLLTAFVLPAFGGMPRAQAQGLDTELLSSFCQPPDIRGSQCLKAKDYPDGETCDVSLTPNRHIGNFLPSGSTLLLVQYGSDCESHANQFGGAVLYEVRDTKFVFRGFYPGFVVGECVVVPGGAKQDRLICLSGFLGQGFLEGAVSEYVFSAKGDSKPDLSVDVLLSASSSVGAYGAETVDCNEAQQRISLSKMRLGRAPNTVSLQVEYADQQAVRQACTMRRKPKSAVADPGEDHAFLGAKATKTSRFVIDLNSKQVMQESEFRKMHCPKGVCSQR